jgi:ArsR family transcriptional regulator
LRTIDEDRDDGAPAEDRFLHKVLVELTVSAPLGNLLDIGCGEGRLLKLLASRAHRVVGVDIDPEARRLARAEMLLAGLPNCSLRQGDMYGLPFEDETFDTIILDDVLSDAQRPADALREARRLLRTGGRMLMLATVGAQGVPQLTTKFAAWAADTGLRLAPPRPIPEKKPGWLLGVVTP